ncbi:glycosyltransferase family 4 protein [Halomarina halobia]|uniref:Glycosyltransferase family 4 protein n=1 Tax=Halomarina halobia TaxID=3033386 RepID=A0ABD6AE85_9EURY|nr:glycosyltransferase family 4 protein [Halomarina sp. PSR21]
MTDRGGDDPIRVLAISQLFPPESMGGAHRWHKLARHLPDGFECHVIAPPPIVPLGTFERSNRPWRRETVDGVSVTRLWTYQPAGDDDWAGVGRILNYLVFALLASLYVVVNWRRYDCVVTFVGPHSTLVPGIVAKALGRAWIVDVDDLWIDNAVDLGFIERDSAVHRAVEALERRAFALADHVVVLTPTMAEQYAAKHDAPDDDFTPVPYGIDLDEFATTTATADGTDPLDDRPVVYTGKFGQAQAFEPFFRGFARLDGDRELLVVGFGDRRDELERLARDLGIEDRVSFEGPVPREEIPSILRSAALSWVPLKTEHSLDYARPTKLLETMAVGTPYVASRVTEIEVVTERSGAGVAVDNDPAAIADAMRDVLADDAARAEMGRRGAAFVSEHHRWETLGARVGDVIADATGGRSRRATTAP